MGKTRTEIEYELERQRNAVRARVSRLRGRLREDVDKSRERARERVPGPVRPAEISEHPKTLVGATFGAGLAAGFATGGNGRSEEHRNGAASDERRATREPEEKQGMVSGFAGSIAGYLQAEAVRQLKQAWKDLRKGEGQEEGRPDRATERREGQPVRGSASSGNGRS